ncbi:heme-binding protein [Rhizobium sp. 16-449-1b]|uniref:Heme-binding protein n=2 Tax=Rhizobium/Agrobacterium group TaxID=227290 RepID=A0A546X6P1_RHIRH|nr:heme-binding protein [Rhizobium sp. 16-488-2b]MBO9176808.1 heme-binding protein [Rhizobium sp. 16-488-2a]MBO9197377.1 heme-binding protein [Rhizobium sp. 16-449-1b]TRA86364.1 heme-binding protein [Agrobacterium salinitolerans]TRA96393.1 heme-binding protein [Rhizobium rhizogenes]
MKRFLVVAFAFSSTIGAAQADLLTEKNIPSDLAVRMASNAVEACAADKYNVSAAVVDRAGVLRALVRADNAGPHTVDSSRAKAFTSASLRIPTSKLAENAANNPASAQVVNIPGFLVLGGGVPIKAGDVVIGAIGVGGAPGANLDEACAVAAIKEAAEALK